MNITNPRLIFILALFSVFLLIVSGCSHNSNSSQGNPNQDSQRPNGKMGGPGQRWNQNGGRANLTDEQKKEFMEQRIKLAVDACNGKNTGDNCSMDNQRFIVNGTCETRNNTLTCNVQRMNGTAPRGYPRPEDEQNPDGQPVDNGEQPPQN